MSDAPWALPAEEVLRAQRVDAARGLEAREVLERRGRHGRNRLRAARRRSGWSILARQFASLIVVLLGAAAAVAFAMRDWVEGVAILAVIAINAAIGFFTELRAVRSMEALHRLGQASARVRREGAVREVPAAELVPGDIVLVEAGDVVTADLRLVKGSKLQANESALTGESAPVEKRERAAAHDTPLAERTPMLYKGTALTRGAGEAVVVGTGLDTELGRITSLVEETEAAATPLERRLDRLAHRLVWVTLVLAAAVAAAGLATGRELGLTIQTAIALAVATIPEGLPVVATIALARGMWRMARRNALINRLSAVETLGATGVICTDKTGTLTENRMTVHGFELAEQRTEEEALEVGALCNNAEGETGDPMEVALLAAAQKAGIGRRALEERLPRVNEVAFDPETRMMATFHRGDGGLRIAIKGAPEAVINACTLDDPEKKEWLRRNEALAAEGLRVLGLARAEAADESVDPYDGPQLVGLVALRDPPREDVREAIARCRAAGIRVVMVTGDQAVTARAIAEAVGLGKDLEVLSGSALRPFGELSEAERQKLLRAGVFARVSPRQKLDLIDLHQRSGEVVAMTGDGVNDAPALKKADIGIAMGKRGTQVAREAAAMVLRDDAFASIVAAVEQGRIIFDNIRRFVLYLLSCNVSEVMVVGLASLVSAPLPILPLQILFLNLVTDVFPALALGVGKGDPRVMRRAPRPAAESILERRHWIAIAAYGALITAATLGAFAVALLGLRLDERAAVTVSFLTLALAQLWHVFNMGALRNPWVWSALALCVALLAAALYLPALADVLHLSPPDAGAWLVIAGFSVLPLAAGQAWLASRRFAI
ncbi:MAG TPA: cation-transporting P-type ATPase [Burkholderiales bacterium]